MACDEFVNHLIYISWAPNFSPFFLPALIWKIYSAMAGGGGESWPRSRLPSQDPLLTMPLGSLHAREGLGRSEKWALALPRHLLREVPAPETKDAETRGSWPACPQEPAVALDRVTSGCVVSRGPGL